MQSGGQSEVAAVLGMMETACGRLASVESKLENVALINQSLELLMKGQGKMETTIERIEQAHRDAREQYRDQLHEHQLEIQAIKLKLENYNTIIETVESTKTTLRINSVFTTILGIALGLIVANGPAWWSLFKPHPKTTSLPPMTMPRERG